MATVIKPVIGVDENTCINCHLCISVCPVKFCIDGSGDKVRIRHEACIGCAAGIKETTGAMLEIFQGLLEMSGGTDQLMGAIKHLTAWFMIPRTVTGI